MAMDTMVGALRDKGLLDFGVLAAGLERGWAAPADVSEHATNKLVAGDERPEVVELATAEDLAPERVVEMLRHLARLDRLPSLASDMAIRVWMFAALEGIAQSVVGADEKLDRLEEAYAAFGYPEEMRECSRYYIPPQDRARGIRVGETTASPLEAMNELLSQLRRELGADTTLRRCRSVN